MGKTSALPTFHGNPLATFADESAWRVVNKANYVVIPLELCYNKNINQSSTFAAKDVYLSDLRIAKIANDTTHSDISDAIRVHFSSIQDDANVNTTKNFLVSKKGGTTDTHGYLDIDAEEGLDYTYPDSDPYGVNGSDKQFIDYGQSGQQVAFSAEKDQRAGSYYNYQGTLTNEQTVYPLVVGNEATNKAKLAKLEYDTGASKCIGTTTDTVGKYLNVTVTIWIEGWQKLAQSTNGNNQPTDYNAVWDAAKFVASEFEVSFEFAVDVE